MNDDKSGTARQKIEDKNWEPAEPSAKDALITEERSLDIGESANTHPAATTINEA